MPNYVALVDDTGNKYSATNPLPVVEAASATSPSKAEDGASADGDTGIPSMAVRKATPANTSGADGDYEFLQMSSGRLWTSTEGNGTATTPSANIITAQRPSVTQVVSTALEASHVLKASAGQLVQLTIFNSAVSAQFVLVMNSTTVPANGAVTLLYPPIPIGAGQIVSIDFPAPLVASTGISVSNSSTGSFTKTIGSADCVFYAQVN